ncbi:MAG: NFYB/HAP3 family transcription factor subunit [Candidatus Micrarchaeia archaeon]
MAILPRLELERIIRRAGAERVALDAPDAMAEILEDRAIAIVERALAIARHARRNGRKKRNGNGKRRRTPLVLTKEDILLAVS